jgi:hypothetical protein
VVGQPLLREEAQEEIIAVAMMSRKHTAMVFFIQVVLCKRFDCILRHTKDNLLQAIVAWAGHIIC